MGYQFSPEELQVLKECNRESFFQRSVPIGTGLGVATWFAVQNGYLKPSARFGAGPKALAAVTVGYFLGKISYQSKCAEKIMRLPNSRLGEVLRRKKKGEFFESFTPDGGLSLAPFGSTTDIYTDEGMKANTPTNSLDLDLNRPSNSGLDDIYRASLDDPETNFNDNLPLEPPKSSVSYEELRKKNREEYERKLQSPPSKSPVREEVPIITRQQQPERDDSFERNAARNRYGDVWTK